MKRIATLVAGIALIMPGTAMALTTSQCLAEFGQACSVGATQAANGTGEANESATGTSASARGTLPFTGLDVALLVAGGGTLLGAGLVVRRASRRLE